MRDANTRRAQAQIRSKQKQRRNFLAKVKFFAAALFWLAQFALIVLQILKLWGDLTR